MRSEDRAFLALLGAGLSGRKMKPDGLPEVNPEHVFARAAEQGVLPLVFDAAAQLPYEEGFKETRKGWQTKALSAAMREITKTNEFLLLLEHAKKQGLNPVVVKGLICRKLYPVPCLRPSVDEDLLICPDEAEMFHVFFLAEGLTEDDPAQDRAQKFEISYHRPDSPTYIELHKYLFDPEETYFARWNEYFAGALDRTVTEEIEGVPVRTLHPDDHILFLILHALKHFLYSGFGVRLAADLVLFAEAHADVIDWRALKDGLTELQAFDFTKALFKIGALYLLPEAKFYGRIAAWHINEIDEEPLLHDILSGGIHGNISLERLHSSSITLEAARGEKRSVLSKVFISRKKLKRQYHYLKRFPFLLPAAWAQRLIRYMREAKKGGTKLTAPVQIGSSRTSLLKKYHIIN